MRPAAAYRDVASTVRWRPWECKALPYGTSFACTLRRAPVGRCVRRWHQTARAMRLSCHRCHRAAAFAVRWSTVARLRLRRASRLPERAFPARGRSASADPANIRSTSRPNALEPACSRATRAWKRCIRPSSVCATCLLPSRMLSIFCTVLCVIASVSAARTSAAVDGPCSLAGV